MTDSEEQAQEQTQPEYFDKDGKPIPLYKDKDEEQKGFKINFPKFIGAIVLIILVASFTPLYSILMRAIPDSLQAAVLKPLYRSVPIGSQPQEYYEPMKIPLPKSGTLPVLGFDTRVCFSFYSTIESPDPNYIKAEQLESAKKGKKIAEILAVGAQDKYEYRMEDTSYSETIDKDNKVMSIVCQKFGRAYGSTPKNIKALYIRPLEPFKAHKTVWKSIKHLYDNYSSPLELNGGDPPPE